MDRYPLGRDIHVSWSLDLDGQDINLSECTFFFAYKAAGGSRFVPANQYTVSNDTLQWTFAGEDQFAYGVYSLHLVVFSDGEPVAEFKNDYAFEIIHGAVSDQPQSVALESSVETTQDDFPEPDDEPSDEPAEYHSSSPLYMEKIPLGSNIVLNWNLLTPETFDFDLTECELRLYYTASGSGFKRAHDYELKTESGYTIQWNFAGSEQTRYGIYSLFLEVYNDGLIAVLEREYAFELVHRNGSDLADRIISFDSIVTSFGGGALFSLIDVLNDGHSTVYRGDGETPAAAGDVLQFDGEKWHATQAGNLDAIQALNSDVAALWVDSRGIHTRVEDAEGNISSLEQTAEGFDLRVASVEGNVGELTLTAEEFETRISDAEGNISTLEQTAESLTSSIEDAEGNISVLQQTAESLTSAISDAEGNISVLQQTAAGLESRVEDAEDNISTISQTAESIQLQVDSQSGDIATLQVSARGLTSRVSNAEGDISTLDQRADAIEVSVQGLSTEITRYEGVTDAALRNMQDQIDGVIETWYYNGVPTLNNLPASQWSAAEMANHVGDLYYDKNTGKAYRFMLDNTQTPAVYVWVELADEDIAKALALAGEKKRVFVTTPYAPYDAGDLWVRQKTVGGNTVNEIWRCKTSRAADASPSFLESEWESADNFGYVVNKSNLEVLSDAIVGQVTQITYNTDGTVSTEAKSAIEANARSVRISTVVDNVAYAGISIDSTNHTGSVTIFSDNFYVKAPQGNKTALSIINLPNGNSVIDVASLNVNGIFTTSAWTSEESALQGYADAAAGDAQSAAEGYADTAAGNAQTAAEGYADTKAGEAETNAKNYANSTAYLNEHVLPMIQQETSGLAVDSDYSYLKTALENRTTALGGLMLTSLIQLGATQSGSSWTVNSGISGIYDSTKRGNGIAAWFGGPMVDHLASPATTPYAATLFRMDGSGYLAGGEIQWGASGELIIHGTSAATPITIENAELKDGNKTLSVGDLILNIEDLLELKSWFVKETYDPGDGQTHYRLKLVGSSTGIEGLHVEGHILSDDDQIVGGGTPGGGGGGGASYLSDLLDVKYGLNPSADDLLIYSSSVPLNPDGTVTGPGWTTIAKSSVGRIYTGGTGITIGNDNTISVTTNTYAPYNSAGYLPLSAGLTKPLTDALLISGDSVYELYLNNTSSGATSSGIRFQVGGTTQGALFVDTSHNLIYFDNTANRTVYHSGNLTKSVLTTLLEGDSGYYVKKSGDTMSSSSYVPLTLNSTSTVIGMAMQLSGVTKMNVAFSSNTIGAYIQNVAVSGNPYVNLASDGQFKYSNNYVFLHSQNYSSYALPLAAGSSYPLTGALYVGGTFGDKVVLETASGGNNWCNILYWPSSGKYWSVGAGADTFYWYRYGDVTGGTVMSLDRNGYLTVSGGETVSANSNYPLTVTNSGSGATSLVCFYKSTTRCGWLGFSGQNSPVYVDGSTGNNAYTLLHTGNASISNSAITIGSTSLGTSTAPIGWADAILTHSITTEANITQSGLRLYDGSGGTWAGSISTMGYAAILAIGGPSRGWQMWARRAGDGLGGLRWRRGNADATAWEAERLIYDSGNANRSDVPWACSTLTTNGIITVSGIGGAAITQKKGTGTVFSLGSGSSATTAGKEYGILSLFQNGTEMVRLYANSSNPSWINAGNVGIGTSSPGYKFHIYGTSGATITPMSVFEHTGDYQWNCPSSFLAPNVTAGHNVSFGIGKAASSKNQGVLEFYYAGSSSNSNLFGLGLYGVDYALTVSGGGNVGIGLGTTAPIYTLHVAGASAALINSSGSVYQLISAGTDGWSYIRLSSGDSSDTVWDLAATNSTSSAIAQVGAFEIRDGKDSAAGISIRHASSDYGKLVVRVNSGQSSIGYWSTSNNLVSGYPIWTVGYTADTGDTFGWYCKSSTPGWKMNLTPNGDLTNTGSIYTNRIFLSRSSNNAYGRIGFYSSSYYTWYEYMTNAGAVSPTGANAPQGSVVKTWALRSLIENSANYGWTWESCTNNAKQTPVIQMELSSNTGVLVTRGDQVISSDINLKTNLAPVTYGVEDIAKTRAVTFDWKDGRGKSAGSIAQDWKPLIPELVHGEEGNMTLAYGQIALVNSILLARKSESHEERIKELEARVAELEMENERLRMN